MPTKKSAATRVLGEAIRAARRERENVQEALPRVGLDRSYIGAIERGERKLALARC
jgi:hypothetical protein